MEFILNSRGDRKLCFAGSVYNKKATKKTVIQWECCLRRGQNCKGLLTTTTYAYNFLKFFQYWQVLVRARDRRARDRRLEVGGLMSGPRLCGYFR